MHAVEAFAGDMNSDGVKIFAAEHLDARDDSVSGGECLLHEGGRVYAEVETILFDRRAQLLARTKPLNSRTTATNIWL